MMTRADLQIRSYWLKRGNPLLGELDITLDACPQRDGTILWAVRCAGCCLSADGFFEEEPGNSSRDDAFAGRCRFTGEERALAAYERYLANIGRGDVG